MTTMVEAIYENGVLRPVEPITLMNGAHVRVIVIAAEPKLHNDEQSPKQIVANLIGCLGQEPAADYDFKLNIGGLYETR